MQYKDKKIQELESKFEEIKRRNENLEASLTQLNAKSSSIFSIDNEKNATPSEDTSICTQYHEKVSKLIFYLLYNHSSLPPRKKMSPQLSCMAFVRV